MAQMEAQQLEKTYRDGTRALRGASFAIGKGEFVAIMGPSGSGKSTLLHILGFLDRQTSGSYTFEGRPFEGYSDEDVARIRNKKMGFVFQMFNLLPRVSALENVKLPLLYSRVPERDWDMHAHEALGKVGLSHRTQFDPSKLSGGERQRVAIARALVNHPDVIFADEPTGNLDSKSGQAIMEILEQLNKEGHTVVLITHETHAAEHAEHIIHIHDGIVKSDERVRNRRNAQSGFIK